jgi:hypothetical protein
MGPLLLTLVAALLRYADQELPRTVSPGVSPSPTPVGGGEAPRVEVARSSEAPTEVAPKAGSEGRTEPPPGVQTRVDR